MSIAIKTCSACGQVNPAFHGFCPACGETLSDAKQRTAPWTFAVRFPPMADAVNPSRRRKRHHVSDGQGVGLTWIGFIAIAVPIIVSARSTIAYAGWATGILLVLLGFFLMRRDPTALAQMGWLTNGLAILALALVGFKVVGTNEPIHRVPAVAAVTPQPTATEEEAESTPSANVEMLRGNAEHTGELPGPGITGNPYQKWRQYTGGELRSSPAIANGLVFLGTKNGFVYAFDAISGDVRWSKDFGDYIITSSPAVVNDMVYVGAGYSLLALNATNGTVEWEATSIFFSDSDPTVVDGVVYIATKSSRVYAYDAANGTQLWSNQTDGLISSGPAVSNGVVYVGTDSGKLLAINAKTGQLNWSFATDGGVASSPAISGDLVYVTSRGGKIYAIDIATHKAKWSYDAGGEASPTVADGVVYVGSSDKGLYALDALNGGTPHWLHPTGGEITASPVFADGIVYVASGSNLIAVDVATGNELWHYAAGYRIDTSPVVVNGYVYIGGRDGYLDAISGDEIVRDDQT